LSFIIEISRRGYILKEETEHIKSIAEIKYFDEENNSTSLLNEFEVESLTIPKGNLTNAERKDINLHPIHTYNILKMIHWTRDLENVPLIAANHHERLDGSGYCKGLKGEEISIQTRILSILDVFEALTAIDRPYKTPLSIESTLKVIEEDVNDGKFDKDLYEVFINEKVYEINCDTKSKGYL
jgi:HD-GYP domain-containing protein (c-di-GMP phosphodiesterase class II)